MTARLPVRGPGRPGRRTQRRASHWFDRRRVLAAIAMLAAGGAIYGVAVSPAFVVRDAVVDGGTLTGSSALTRAIGITDPAPNAFRVETEAIRARLAALPGVERAEIFITLPGTVHVRLVEREAVLAWQIGASRFLVGRDGYVISDAAAVDATDAARDLAASLPAVLDHRPDIALAQAADAAARAAELRAAAAAPGDDAGGDTAADPASEAVAAPSLGPAAPSPTPRLAKAGASPRPAKNTRPAASATPGKGTRPGGSARPGASPRPGRTPRPAPTVAADDQATTAAGEAGVPETGPSEAVAGVIGAPADPPVSGAPATLPASVVPEAPERIPGVPIPGETLSAVDLDVATRLLSLVPSDVGSAAGGLAVSIDPTEGWTLRPVDGEAWVAIFGIYLGEIRRPTMIPDQVRVLRSLLLEIGETSVKRIVLADANGGTFTKRR